MIAVGYRDYSDVDSQPAYGKPACLKPLAMYEQLRSIATINRCDDSQELTDTHPSDTPTIALTYKSEALSCRALARFYNHTA